MVHSGNHLGGHLRDTHCNRLALGGHHHHGRPNLDILLEPKDTWNHQLCSVSDCVDSRILHNDTRQITENELQRHDDTPQIGLIPAGLESPLGIQHIVHRNHRVLLPEHSGANTSKLLHVRPDSQDQTHVNAHGSYVGPGLTRNPDGGQALLGIPIQQLALIGRSHTQLSLHSRRNRRALETCTGQHFHGPKQLGLAVHWTVKPANCHVFLSRALLCLHQPRRPVDTDQQITRHFRIQRSTVSGLLPLQNSLNPRDDLMGRRVARLIQIDNTILEVLVQFAVERG
mmetsp:Transcript_59041/g.129327  ORF Transcript_59041/g.129327 Transcript_59041/m.129327 type:complete len:285 (+) Transcript_59041:438-1292(+)